MLVIDKLYSPVMVSLSWCAMMYVFPQSTDSLFGWLVADGWCWFVLREEYCWLVAGG
jgi:hypothetical protein